jgi:hypothetical protein
MVFRISILISALLHFNSGWGKVVIHGKIMGYDGKSIVYCHPTIEGVYTPYWKEIKPSSNGTFKVEFENQGYGNTTISYKNLRYRFFHDTHSEIHLEIKEIQSGKKRRISGDRIFTMTDSLKQANTIKISGDYEAINTFYNKNLRSSYNTTQMVDGNYYSQLIYKSTTPLSALTLLDSLKQIEINQIHQLPRTIEPENPNVEKREKDISDFLINEVHAFYSAIFLNGMFLKRKDHIIKTMIDSTAKPNIYNHDWELLIESLNEQAGLNLKPTPNSPDYIDFMESMAYALVNYKQYDFPQNPTISLDEELTNRLFRYDTTLFYDKNSRFAHELGGIQRFLNDQLYYSPTLLHAVYDLQAKYPTTTHFDFYTEKIKKLRNSLEIAKQDFKNAKIIRNKHDSFDDLLKRFAGNVVLIDIWATWC